MRNAVARDNTVRCGKRILQLSAVPNRPYYVQAHVRVHEYPNATPAVFHGPRFPARYQADGGPFETPTRKAARPASTRPAENPADKWTAAPP